MTIEFIQELILRDYDFIIMLFCVAFPIALLIMIVEKLTNLFLGFVKGDGVMRFK